MPIVVAACGPVVPPPVDTTSTSSGPEPGATTSGDTTRGDPGSTTVVPPSTTSDTGDEPRLDLPPDVNGTCQEEWATMGCGMPSDQGGVMATTPLGEFTTTRALFASLTGCSACDVFPNIYSITLFDASVPIDEIDPWGTDETLVLYLDFFEGPAGEPTLATLQANRGGVGDQVSPVEVIVDIIPTAQDLAVPFDPANAVVVTGSVTVMAPGWSVAGTFGASYCPDLNEFIICE